MMTNSVARYVWSFSLALLFVVCAENIAQEVAPLPPQPEAPAAVDDEAPLADQPFTPQGQVPTTEDPRRRIRSRPQFATPPAPEPPGTSRTSEAPAVSETTGTSEAALFSPTEAGDVLTNSLNITSVTVQRRSPVSVEPYIRGYRAGQIYTQADGANLLPVRRDLDSLISRIDPSLIREIRVIPGPYGLSYGPGFSFLDVQTVDTPRYDSFENHYSTGFTTRTNGGQLLVRETVFGGSERHGYIGNFTFRKGSDYAPGPSASVDHIPSSYEVSSGFLKYSKDLSPEARFEIKYDRLDEWNTEYAAQFFDTNHVATDAVVASYIVEDPYDYFTLAVDGWYSFTRLTGDTLGGGKRDPFPVIDRVENALEDATGLSNVNFDGFNYGDLNSAGFRISKTKGKDGEAKLRLGADVRFTRQGLTERYNSSGFDGTDSVTIFDNFITNMPTAFVLNPGAFVEYTKPWKRLERLTTKLGGRIDFVHTDADANEIRSNTSLLNIDQLDQDDVLWACYMTNQLKLSDRWAFTLAGGHAERAPSLIDRYADGLFLAIMQTGFSRVIGEPTLKPEGNWQADAGLKFTGDRTSASLNYFYSWISNYNLYQGLIVGDPTGARLLLATNAELVTLTGFELDGELELSNMLSLFGTARYLLGDDRNILLADGSEVDQPLYGISPLEGRVGLRLHDEMGGEKWGVELSTRMVTGQNRLAGLRLGSTTVQGIGPLEGPTAGFTVWNLRGYYNYSDDLNLVAGVENLFGRTYLEHLDLRIPPDPPFDETRALHPGFTPYLGIEWIH